MSLGWFSPAGKRPARFKGIQCENHTRIVLGQLTWTWRLSKSYVPPSMAIDKHLEAKTVWVKCISSISTRNKLCSLVLCRVHLCTYPTMVCRVLDRQFVNIVTHMILVSHHQPPSTTWILCASCHVIERDIVFVVVRMLHPSTSFLGIISYGHLCYLRGQSIYCRSYPAWWLLPNQVKNTSSTINNLRPFVAHFDVLGDSEVSLCAKPC